MVAELRERSERSAGAQGRWAYEQAAGGDGRGSVRELVRGQVVHGRAQIGRRCWRPIYLPVVRYPLGVTERRNILQNALPEQPIQHTV